MGTFTAALRAIGDAQALPATVKLEEGRLSIAAGESEIGTWSLTEIDLEPIPLGYRLGAEGEQILIELKDVDGFSEALKEASKRKIRIPSLRKAKSEKADTGNTEPTTPSMRAPASSADQGLERRMALPPATEQPASKQARQPKNPDAASRTARSLAFVDRTLLRAQKRLGPYLPEWLFTRFMFGVAVIAVVLMVFLPGLVSAVMLVAGAVLVVLGAIAYSDPMLASRWLPGRTQPPHVLLFGVAILIMGVLLGVIANWVAG